MGVVGHITIKIKGDLSECMAVLDRCRHRWENLERVYRARQAALDMEDAIGRVNDLLQDRRGFVARLRDEVLDVERLEDR